MWQFLIIGYVSASAWAIISVIMHGTRASRSFGWIFAIILFPILGALLYYMFGLNRRKFKFFVAKGNIKRRLYDEKYKEHKIDDFESELTDGDDKILARALAKSINIYPYTGNRLTLLNTGQETFDAIFAEIERAEKFIHIQYYRFEEGILLDRFHTILKKKIAQGVEVRILYDSFGSSSFRGKLKRRFLNIGAEAFPMLPLRMWNFMYTLNYRNHRKIIIVDGHIGFIGGVNVSDKYIMARTELGIWSDLHIKMEGPSVDSLHRIFIKDFHFASRKDVLPPDRYLPKIKPGGNSVVQIVASGPDSDYPTILHQYIGMMGLAKKSIRIANPYFVPGQHVLNTLILASLGGIEVTLLVPKISDSIVTSYSMYSHFDTMLKAGIRIFLRNNFSHRDRQSVV